MTMLSVIPGAASNTCVRALMIARDARTEPVARVRADGGTVHVGPPTTPEVVNRSPRLARALHDARVIVRRLEVTLSNPPPEGARVTIEASVDGRLQTLELKTLPRALPPEGLSFIVASCFDAQFKKGEKLRAALSSALPGHPPAAFQLWVGDNVYLDVPGFGPENLPYEQTLERYLGYLLQSSYACARSLHPNFTTYDDHELWNDYPEVQRYLPRTSRGQRDGYEDAALECLELFQSSLNLNPASPDGRSFRIDFSNVSFFVADTRTQRKLANSAATGLVPLMTALDLRALETWCAQLNAPGVLVLGQPLWIAPVTPSVIGIADHNLPFFRAHYERIWSALRTAPFDILVLSGDIHYSRVMRLSMSNAANRNVFEIVASPASEIPTIGSIVGNVLIGTGIKQDRVAPTAPGTVAGSAQKLRAECLFGTAASNSIARVTLRALGRIGVEVGASFVDYERGPAALASVETVQGVPKWGTKKYSHCHEPRVCVLRMR